MSTSDEARVNMYRKMRSNPWALLRGENGMMIRSARGGKTQLIMALIGDIGDAAINHRQRMRGRYVLTHKGRANRQHRLRISYMDRKPFRKLLRTIKRENGDG